MKLHPDFILRKIGDTAVLVPFGQKQVDFNGMLTLNKTGAFIAETLGSGDVSREDLVRKITERFDVDPETADTDLGEILEAFRANGVLAENNGES